MSFSIYADSGDHFFMFRSQSSLRSVAMEIITAMKADIVL